LRTSIADGKCEKGRNANHELRQEPPPIIPLNFVTPRKKTAIAQALAMIWIN
jgi:hypothetical protein